MRLRVAQAETTAAWAMAADVDTFKQILRRLRRKLRKLEERCKAAASLERAKRGDGDVSRFRISWRRCDEGPRERERPRNSS